jgi:hypothetical protein
MTARITENGTVEVRIDLGAGREWLPVATLLPTVERERISKLRRDHR